MPEVAVIGVGRTVVSEHWETGLRALAAEAIRAALDDAGLETVDALYLGNAYGGTASSQLHLGALVADYVGLSGIEAYTTEAAEASGAAALRTAYLAVKSGDVKTALVAGVEKSTDTLGSARVRALNAGLDSDYELAHGVTLTALAAMLMRRYMYEYGLPLEAFEGFTINAHANGTRSEHAMFRNSIKPGRFAAAPMIAEPVSLFDSAPDADGAAAVLLTSAEIAADLVPLPVRITGSAAATDTFTLNDRSDPLYFRAAALSAQRAFAQASITPEDVSLFELHDAYTIFSALTLEAVGYAARGEGWKLAQENVIALDSRLPISTFGGLKARGNPAGAAGVYQAVEACLQLRDQAGPNQVPGAKTALIQNVGGLCSTAITHILQV